MTDLTDRMRTLAAYIASQPRDNLLTPTEELWDKAVQLLDDAAALLVKGSEEIELLAGPIDLGERIEIIEAPVVTPPPVVAQTSAVWIGDDLKPIPNAPSSKNACPKCDSRAQKQIRKKGKSLWLVCPVCEHAWTR